MLKNVQTVWGTDPEAFFVRNGNVIGSEKVIPAKGVGFDVGKITRDGVQFELHPNPGPLSELVRNTGELLLNASDLAKSRQSQICFDGLVEVTREELDSLSPKSRVLGCQPSQNIYGARPINVDPVEYRKRSAGGHIHVGILDRALKQERRKLIPLMDVLVGNTCVLLDRDPGAAERRENYGRAGECRYPKHGIEYRTTSNFWLRDPSLMFFVFGMAQQAINTLAGPDKAWNMLSHSVNMADIKEAINTNNFGLATRNFTGIVPFIREWLPQSSPLNRKTVEGFLHSTMRVGGIDKVFPVDQLYAQWGSKTYRTKLELE